MGTNVKIVSPSTRPEHLINTCRTFGYFGPAYQSLNVAARLNDEDVLMRIRVLGNGEELDYRYSLILNDPVAEVA